MFPYTCIYMYESHFLQLCSGEGGLPRGVELALANGYSLAGQPLRAFSHLKSNRYSNEVESYVTM